MINESSLSWGSDRKHEALVEVQSCRVQQEDCNVGAVTMAMQLSQPDFQTDRTRKQGTLSTQPGYKCDRSIESIQFS